MRSNLALVAVSAVFFGVAAQAQETPRRGGILTFSNSLGEPETYDCHATGSTSVLYRAAPHYSLLVKLDPTTSEVVPDLAESWTISPDMKTYTFKLRSGVRFHDGSELTSADIKATLDRIRNPPAGVVSTGSRTTSISRKSRRRILGLLRCDCRRQISQCCRSWPVP